MERALKRKGFCFVWWQCSRKSVRTLNGFSFSRKTTYRSNIDAFDCWACFLFILLLFSPEISYNKNARRWMNCWVDWREWLMEPFIRVEMLVTIPASRLPLIIDLLTSSTRLTCSFVCVWMTSLCIRAQWAKVCCCMVSLETRQWIISITHLVFIQNWRE